MVEFNALIQAQFVKMCQTGKLFRVTLTGQEVWDLYLESFGPGQDPIFRDPDSSSHNCNFCKNFIRRYGNIVSIDENFNIITMFDVDASEEYKFPALKLSEAISKSKVKEVFFETFDELNSLPYESCSKNNSVFRLGMAKNVKRYTREEAEKFGVVKPDEIRTFNHFHLDLPTLFVDKSGESVESLMGKFRDAKNVFQRTMEEIPLDTLKLVRDLINQNSLLNGTTHLSKVEEMLPMKEAYDALPVSERDNWCWVTSYRLPFAKFKNELIGVLCTELAEGEELNKACQSWNKRVDPVNYMKAVAPITQKQIDEAKKFVEENGYAESFNRRFATLDDIKASEEVKHINSGSGKLKDVSVFDGVKSTSTRHKRSEFEGVEEISIEKFMKDILPGCTSVEAYLKNSHEQNMVSLTTANDPDSKPIFKWDNNYSWTFNGNLAGKSQIKEAIKSRGGKTEGVLNIRLAFPNTTDDYDLHVIEPKGNHISYSSVRKEHTSSGMLDLDAQGIDGHQPPEKRVENVIYTDSSRMPQGKYLVYVHNYSGRGFRTNFTLEVEADGEMTTLELENLTSGNTANVVEIHFSKGQFEVKALPGIKIVNSNSVSREIYGLQTNDFHKVNLICLSPNHWGENNVGNKHYLFMLENCKTPQSIRSFHNENLNNDLLAHRKVMEVLGATKMIEPTQKQLSGLGFNSTIKDELIVKVSGTFKRMLKITF